MIDQPIVDVHLHLWDPEYLRYPWLAELPTLNRKHLLPDYGRATDGYPIERMVFLQCEVDAGQYQEEADWVSGLAQEDPRIQGIVSWAPLEKGEAARPDLERLTRDPLLKGTRRIIESEENVRFCLQPDFIRGVQMLAEFGLSFDLCIKGDEQFANALELVRQCPDVPVILDHIGKPFIKEGIVEPWAAHLRQLAALPNTFCKVSGLVNEAEWGAWSGADLKPYLDCVFESFGFDRVCFGGDWPVCTLAASYRSWIEALWTHVESCTAEERRKLFHDNALAFYRLEE